ncbi:hypothetical protein SSYRP_v1c07200 [Spiroplasma syrphidicola EA-1]|uniref:Spiralin n=1 Tax=Spiroplasma syrphidicola EA-1 TaxID=1276229 RepID=R4UJJ8_9MOLU|nr:spiralin repeat-containing protein [Spiroplasma syrphidicola]AGM26310.1 hypothetical protein SSYRP_v1c07200 [Spiroplasma syrphidicola EA-1]
MKKLLAILGAFGLTATGATSVIACKTTNNDNNPTVEKKDISKTVVNDPKTILNHDKTYGDLNKDETILKSVVDAINGALSKKLKSTVTAADFNLKNDKDEKAKQVAGKVLFTVTAKADSKLITGTFSFTNTLTEPPLEKNSISEVTMTDLGTVAKPEQTYGQLNQDADIIKAVVTAINEQTKLSVTEKDFDLTNDQEKDANQKSGAVVEFTVTARSDSKLIKDSFNFTNTLTEPPLEKNSISEVTMTDLGTVAKPEQTYGQLNQDADIIKAVVTAINEQTKLSVSEKDFNLTNDQDKDTNQKSGVAVKFTVTATSDSKLIKDSFNFTNTLTQPPLEKNSIEKVIMTDLGTVAKSEQTYGELNQDAEIIKAVVTAINEQTKLSVTEKDFDLTNDQDKDANQKSGVAVKFTVTATSDSKLIKDSFNFTNTLTEPPLEKNSIEKVTMTDLGTVAKSEQTYGELNQDAEIIKAVVTAINEQTKLSVSEKDFNLTNDQDKDTNQKSGVVVKFTVTATSDSKLITGTFSFTNTLK